MVSCKTSLFKNAPTNLHEIFSINVHSYEEQVEFVVAKTKTVWNKLSHWKTCINPRQKCWHLWRQMDL